MSRTIQDQAAIVGIGQTELSSKGGLEEDELTLACLAISNAIDDAGLSPADVAQREGHLPLQSELLGRERAAHVCVRVSKELAAHRAVEFTPTTQPSRDGHGAMTD